MRGLWSRPIWRQCALVVGQEIPRQRLDVVLDQPADHPDGILLDLGMAWQEVDHQIEASPGAWTQMPMES